MSDDRPIVGESDLFARQESVMSPIAAVFPFRKVRSVECARIVAALSIELRRAEARALGRAVTANPMRFE
ncbi:hypothetical protein A1351_08210 [Methylosinus sp. R-45379]|nr:hypothetical protein A1351_08210 [Methylosinus sp. R-45379]